MNLLQFFFIISWIIILIIAIDVARRQKFNALHFLVFISIWVWLLVFTFFPNILNNIWSFFWVARWADVLVYASIVFLLYFVLLLLNKIEFQKEDITQVIREIAIQNSSKKELKWELCFIIACYNEEKIIDETISNLINNNYRNIILVNDWSKDNTFNKIKRFNNDIIILNHYKNRWQWAALETWFEYIRRFWYVKYVCTYDADWQHDIKDLSNFLIEFDKNKDLEIILWSRFIKNAFSNVGFWRKIILKLAILFTFFISNIKLTDSHNWYRVIKKEALNKIKITIDWMWHASEIIDIIYKNKIKFKEVPVNIKYTAYSISKWQKSSNAINIAFRMIWTKFFK